MKKKQIVWILGIVLVLVCLLAGITIYGKNGEEQVPEETEPDISVLLMEQLELGQKYLLEMDYEQAIVAFHKVIELDARNVDAYIKLGEAYVALGDYEQAVQILQQGVEHAQDDRLQKRLETYEYVKNNQSVLDGMKEALNTSSRDDLWAIQKEDTYQELVSRLDEVLVQDAGDDTYFLVYPCGHVYYGQIEGGMRTGHGIWSAYDYLDGNMDYYDGNWSEDYPNGQGEYWTVCLPVPEDLFYYHANWKDGMEDGTVSCQYTSDYDGDIYTESFTYEASQGELKEVPDLYPDEIIANEEGRYCYYSADGYSRYARRGVKYGISHARKGYDDETGQSVSLEEVLKRKEEIEAELEAEFEEEADGETYEFSEVPEYAPMWKLEGGEEDLW